MSRGSAQYCLQRGEVMLASDFLRIDKMWGWSAMVRISVAVV